MRYPFHAYYGRELEVIHRPHRRCEWIMVRDPGGRFLKIPSWMLAPLAAQIKLSASPIVSAQALVAVLTLFPKENRRELTPAASSDSQGEQDEAATIDRNRNGQDPAGKRNSRNAPTANGAGHLVDHQANKNSRRNKT